MKDTGIKYCKEFANKKFCGKNQKDAYLKAMKWYATNVLAKNKLHKAQFSVQKDGPQSVILHIYVTLDEDEVRSQQCDICRDMHKRLYGNNDCNCGWCNVKAYLVRLDDKLRIARDWYSEKLGPYL